MSETWNNSCDKSAKPVSLKTCPRNMANALDKVSGSNSKAIDAKSVK